MARYGPQFGPDITFLGVPRCTWDEPETYADADVVILGAPFDGGTSYRSGARFGPQYVRQTCYLPHDGSRPSLALRVDGLSSDLTVYDAGDVEMFSGDAERSVRDLQHAVHTVAATGAVPLVLGGDHTITFPNATGVARHHGFGNVALIHFDAHADTAPHQWGHLYGHGTPMRRLIESGAVPGHRFVQIGLRGYWPPPDVVAWMREHEMRTFFMDEINDRGLDPVVDEAVEYALTGGAEAVFLSLDIDVVDPGMAPGTGTPEPGGLLAREFLPTVRRLSRELNVVGADIVEVAPHYDQPMNITAALANRVLLEMTTGMVERRRAGRDPS